MLTRDVAQVTHPANSELCRKEQTIAENTLCVPFVPGEKSRRIAEYAASTFLARETVKTYEHIE